MRPFSPVMKSRTCGNPLESPKMWGRSSPLGPAVSDHTGAVFAAFLLCSKGGGASGRVAVAPCGCILCAGTVRGFGCHCVSPAARRTGAGPLRGAWWKIHRSPLYWRGRACSGAMRLSGTGQTYCSPIWSGWACGMRSYPAAVRRSCAVRWRASLTKCLWMPPAPGKGCSGATNGRYRNGVPSM